MTYKVEAQMRGSRQRMVWATGTVGDLPVRLRNGYGPRFASVAGDIGPDRVRLTYAASSDGGTLSGSIAGEHVEVAMRSGQIIGRISTRAVQFSLSPSDGPIARVVAPAAAPLVDVAVSHQRLGRDIAGRCDKRADAVLILAVLMQSASPTLLTRVRSAWALRRRAVEPAPG